MWKAPMKSQWWKAEKLTASLIDDWNREGAEEELMKRNVPSGMKKEQSQKEQNVMSILIV